MGIRSELEARMRATGKANGVIFDTLELGSAESEIALLEQIELNYPSKTVVQSIPVTYPDPFTPGVMKQATVTRTTQVMMTEAEAVEHRAKLAAKLLSEYYERTGTMPEGFDHLILGESQ